MKKFKNPIAQKAYNNNLNKNNKKQNPINVSGSNFERVALNFISNEIPKLGIKFTTEDIKIDITNLSKVQLLNKKKLIPDVVFKNDKNKTLYVDFKYQTGKGTASGQVSSVAEFYQIIGQQVLFVVDGEYYTKETIERWNLRRKALKNDYYSYMIHLNDLIPFLKSWKNSNKKKLSNIIF